MSRRKPVPIESETAKRLRMEVVGMRAATMTAIQALEAKGVVNDCIAVSLRQHVFMPLDALYEELAAIE